jgi:hypothetical protein
MAENGNKIQRPPDRRTKTTKPSYQPTKSFLKYLTLVQASLSMRDDTCAGSIKTERDRVTGELARKRARTMGEVFEKIYVWRMESFDPGDTGSIYYDDMFPLSVYFDLKRMISFDGAAAEMDCGMEDRLRGVADEPSMDHEESICTSAAPFGNADSTKVH